MHFGSCRLGMNPTNLESMLQRMNREGLERVAPNPCDQLLDAGCGVGAGARDCLAIYADCRDPRLVQPQDCGLRGLPAGIRQIWRHVGPPGGAGGRGRRHALGAACEKRQPTKGQYLASDSVAFPTCARFPSEKEKRSLTPSAWC